MRVLSVTQYGVWGGPHNSNMRIIPPLRTRGVHVTVVVPDEPGDAASRLRQAAVDILEVSLKRPRYTLRPAVHARTIAGFPAEVRMLRGLMREHKIDVVMVNGMGLLQPGIAAKLEGIPVVWQLLDAGYPMLARRIFMPIVVRLTDVLMSTGIAVARVYPGAMEMGDRLVPFFPPVDLNLFKADPKLRHDVRLELGIGPNELLIGTVGNISPQKDHLSFVRMAGALKRIHPNLRFAILGATLPNRRALAEQLKGEAQSLGLRYGRDLIVVNPGSRVFELDQGFDIFCLTSRWEGIPTAMEEAMSLGIPVISTDVGAVREALDDQVSGFVVPAGDQEGLMRATRTLIEQPQLRASMGASARQVAVERFDAEICAQVHLRAFEKAVANGAARTVAPQ